MKYCYKCGIALKENARFCSNCGAEIRIMPGGYKDNYGEDLDMSILNEAVAQNEEDSLSNLYNTPGITVTKRESSDAVSVRYDNVTERAPLSAYDYNRNSDSVFIKPEQENGAARKSFTYNAQIARNAQKASGSYNPGAARSAQQDEDLSGGYNTPDIGPDNLEKPYAKNTGTLNYEANRTYGDINRDTSAETDNRIPPSSTADVPDKNVYRSTLNSGILQKGAEQLTSGNIYRSSEQNGIIRERSNNHYSGGYYSPMQTTHQIEPDALENIRKQTEKAGRYDETSVLNHMSQADIDDKRNRNVTVKFSGEDAAIRQTETTPLSDSDYQSIYKKADENTIVDESVSGDPYHLNYNNGFEEEDLEEDFIPRKTERRTSPVPGIIITVLAVIAFVAIIFGFVSLMKPDYEKVLKNAVEAFNADDMDKILGMSPDFFQNYYGKDNSGGENSEYKKELIGSLKQKLSRQTGANTKLSYAVREAHKMSSAEITEKQNEVGKLIEEKGLKTSGSDITDGYKIKVMFTFAGDTKSESSSADVNIVKIKGAWYLLYPLTEYLNIE